MVVSFVSHVPILIEMGLFLLGRVELTRYLCEAALCIKFAEGAVIRAEIPCFYAHITAVEVDYFVAAWVRAGDTHSFLLKEM